MSTGEPLVAVCDVLVLRALELVGKRIVRFERSRYRRMDGRSWHDAHTLWQADAKAVDGGLADAWDSVGMLLAEHGCCGATPEQLTIVLDRYVRDLVVTQQGHAVDELRYRLAAYLGVPT
ncbi:MAG: hypothetical protein ABR616_05605 [Dermatophilaceae bacterium]